jgi:hypothetical protein
MNIIPNLLNKPLFGEYTKEEIRNHQLNDIQYNGQTTYNTMDKRHTIQWTNDIQYNGQTTYNTMDKRTRTKGEIVIYKTLHRKL